jgi:hypothetical protein
MQWTLFCLGIIDVIAGGVLFFGDGFVRIIGVVILGKGIISIVKSLR